MLGGNTQPYNFWIIESECYEEYVEFNHLGAHMLGLGIDQFFPYDICIDSKWPIFDISFEILFTN